MRNPIQIVRDIIFWFMNYETQEELKQHILEHLNTKHGNPQLNIDQFIESVYVPHLNKANKDWYEKMMLLR